MIAGFIVLAIIAAIIAKKIVDKRRGKSDRCGYGCDGCAVSDSCSGETKAR
ncbi:MAG: FeoB-associated Cys-rich membrane protein [Clostridiales bacterium]|nr:FeoB-associated Cys-rich membrane protein [Clostridiales bacterium]